MDRDNMDTLRRRIFGDVCQVMLARGVIYWVTPKVSSRGYYDSDPKSFSIDLGDRGDMSVDDMQQLCKCCEEIMEKLQHVAKENCCTIVFK
jgi:hypothetical protein